MSKKNIAVFTALMSILSVAAISYADTTDSANPAPNNTGGVLELYFFGSNTCGECLEIKNTLLIPLEQELTDKLKIHYHYPEEDSTSFKLMIGLENKYSVTNPSPQELFFPDTVLLGYSSIMANGRAMIEKYLNAPQRRTSIDVGEPSGNINDILRKRAKNLIFLPVVMAALADSINPCAIATLVFLVSFLATQKRKRSEILAVGLAYSASVFVTYFLMGLGAFKLIVALEGRETISCVISWSAVAFAGIIGIISFVDAFRFKKSGNAKDITLQLPKSIKLRIHKIITTNMKGSRLIIGTIITGFLVTLLEAACTGQTYLPTITALTRFASGDLKVMGLLYLLLYNFIFIVPLLVIMIAVYYGLTWNKLSKIMQNNMTLMKILLGMAMTAIAIGLALYLTFFGKNCFSGNDRNDIATDNVIEQTIANDAE